MEYFQRQFIHLNVNFLFFVVQASTFAHLHKLSRKFLERCGIMCTNFIFWTFVPKRCAVNFQMIPFYLHHEIPPHISSEQHESALFVYTHTCDHFDRYVKSSLSTKRSMLNCSVSNSIEWTANSIKTGKKHSPNYNPVITWQK